MSRRQWSRRRAHRFPRAAPAASAWSYRAEQAWSVAARVLTDPWFVTVVGGVIVALLLVYLGLQA